MRQRGGYPDPPRGGYPGQVPPPGGVTRVRYPPWGGTRLRYPPRGYPGQVPPRGGTRVRYPPQGGTRLRYPRGGGTRVRCPPGGVPGSGTPRGGGWVLGSGTPPGRGTRVRYPPPGGGYPGQVPPGGGVPRSGTPPRGGYPGRTTEGVLTTRRAVCLLRSRRRTFLFQLFFETAPSLFSFNLFFLRCAKRIISFSMLLLYFLSKYLILRPDHEMEYNKPQKRGHRLILFQFSAFSKDFNVIKEFSHYSRKETLLSLQGIPEELFSKFARDLFLIFSYFRLQCTEWDNISFTRHRSAGDEQYSIIPTICAVEP